MAEIKISDLTPKGANLSVTDLLVISEDIGGGLYETKSITGDEVLNAVAKTAVAVRNQTGATIYKGTIVYISGTSGGKALISKAKADAEITSSKTLGVVTADIANNANGNVLTNGLLTDLDTRTTATNPFTTDTLVIGDDLYLSPTTAGYVTNVKPIAPNNLVNIGKVLETSSTTGQILYSIVNGYELGELHDVDTTGAVTGNVLALDGSVWKPTTISSGITIGTTPITSGVAGRVLFEGAGNVVQEDSLLFWDNTNKRLGVGATPATTARLDVRSQGALSTDIAFRVRNSADTANILNVNGAGCIWANGAGAIATNLSFGEGALDANTSGVRNSAFGKNALSAITNGGDCTAIGHEALLVGTGSENTAVGSYSLYTNSTATRNTAVGVYALHLNATGSNNTALGYQAGYSQKGGFNTAIGVFSLLANSTATGNTAVGYNSLLGATGDDNVAIGMEAGKTITSGTLNTVIGGNSFTGITTGSYNTILGGGIIGLSTTLSNNVILADGQGNRAITKDANHNVYTGSDTALATTATNGFLYIPTCAGTPTGVPTSITGKAPIVIDSTNNKMYIYAGGAWVALN